VHDSFGRRNICGKLLKAVSFVNSIATSDIIAGIGADRVWAHSRTILWSLLDAADVDGGLRTATGTSKCTPPHLHSLTQSLSSSELDFWIQELEVLMNSTSCISTTCRHPLVNPPKACCGPLSLPRAPGRPPQPRHPAKMVCPTCARHGMAVSRQYGTDQLFNLVHNQYLYCNLLLRRFIAQ